MSKSQIWKSKYYPDNSKDGTLFFYDWIRRYISDHFIVLNLGAGPTSDRKVRSLRGEVKQVIGIDIDSEVLRNQDLDQAFVVKNNQLPFENNSFDLAWADYVMEHVEDPASFLKEVHRVLKPGASFFFRTPNIFHYVPLVSWMTPHWFHKLIANRSRNLAADAHEPYPTCYLFNSRRRVEDGAQRASFSQVELKFIEAEPSYLMFHPTAFKLGVAYERVVNRYEKLYFLRSNIFGRLQK